MFLPVGPFFFFFFFVCVRKVVAPERRTFSDQYLGQVPDEDGNTETEGAMECCTSAPLSVV